MLASAPGSGGLKAHLAEALKLQTVLQQLEYQPTAWSLTCSDSGFRGVLHVALPRLDSEVLSHLDGRLPQLVLLSF